MYYKSSDSSHPKYKPNPQQPKHTNKKEQNNQKRSNQTKTRMLVGSRILESDQPSTILSRPLFSRSQSLFSGVKIVIAHQTTLMPLQHKNIAHRKVLNNSAQKNQNNPPSRRKSRRTIHVHLRGNFRHKDSPRRRRIPSSKEKWLSSSSQRISCPSRMPRKNKQNSRKSRCYNHKPLSFRPPYTLIYRLVN